MKPTDPGRPPDLRAVLLAGVTWAGALVGFLCPVWLTCALVGSAAAAMLLRRRRGRAVVLGTCCLLAFGAVAGSAMLRAHANTHNPVADLARQQAYARLTGTVTSDPLLREGRFSPYTLTRVRVSEVEGRGERAGTRVPVLVIADASWTDIELGMRISFTGRTALADGADLAAVVSVGTAPTVLRPPGQLLDGASTVRAALRASVAPAGPEEEALVPALVVGDDRAMPAEVVESFQTAGLTHLLAVSGTNLTLVVGFLLVVARWAGVRARGLMLVGALGVVGFVLLARTEPSVVRAAAMGSIALLGMGTNGQQRGIRGLGVAVVVLLLLDPWLALSPGFVLSSLATAGILFLAPPWRDALARWLPRWLAEAVAVPLAAQLACTPVVAAISDEVSLVAVLANMAVAPAVGPATVLGLAGGLCYLVLEPVGLLLGGLAGSCAWWIVTVALHGADLPTAAVGWSASALSIAVLSVSCLALAWVMPRLLGRRVRAVLVAATLAVLVVRPLPTPGWPPDGWLMVACDVGQGDGLVLNAGTAGVVVVDTGPEPALMDRCLDRLGVRRVPVVVLTHFHHDHMAGLPGVLEDRRVGAVEVTALEEPKAGARAVATWVRSAGVALRVPRYGEVHRVGQLTWQVVGPADRVNGPSSAEGSAANNASLALYVEARGVRLLLTGDMEPEAQALLDLTTSGLQVDVLKVPHHGSRYQDPALLAALGARLALISVGEGNDYGHPAPETLRLLEDAGMQVRRTDESGDLAVVLDDGRLKVRVSR